MCREENSDGKKESRLVVDRLLEMGLGLAAYGEEKISAFVREVSARGEAKQEDVARLRETLREKGASFRTEFSARIEKEVARALEKLNLASAAEIADLRRRVAELEKKLDG